MQAMRAVDVSKPACRSARAKALGQLRRMIGEVSGGQMRECAWLGSFALRNAYP